MKPLLSVFGLLAFAPAALAQYPTNLQPGTLGANEKAELAHVGFSGPLSGNQPARDYAGTNGISTVQTQILGALNNVMTAPSYFQNGGIRRVLIAQPADNQNKCAIEAGWRYATLPDFPDGTIYDMAAPSPIKATKRQNFVNIYDRDAAGNPRMRSVGWQTYSNSAPGSSLTQNLQVRIYREGGVWKVYFSDGTEFWNFGGPTIGNLNCRNASNVTYSPTTISNIWTGTIDDVSPNVAGGLVYTGIGGLPITGATRHSQSHAAGSIGPTTMNWARRAFNGGLGQTFTLWSSTSSPFNANQY